MSKKIVIVESPGKIKTIQKYLDNTYSVVSSYGHVRDLPKKELGIDVAHGFEPTYVPDSSKKTHLSELKKMTEKAPVVLLASDDDREGEAIAWHIQQVLNIPEDKYVRIIFRSITKSAIQKALQQPRRLDTPRIHAQQARRILDRLVGYMASPLLWKIIKNGLSAGRVQSVALRLIVEKEREIIAFTPEEKGMVKAIFNLPTGETLTAELPTAFNTYNEAKAFVAQCTQATFTIKSIEKKQTKRSPQPPLMTATMQQAAIQELGFSIDKTTLLAQRLYESGMVTYIRTDSLNLAQEALQDAKNVIDKTYGHSYYQQRNYRNKSTTAQEAHEAIRPTSFARTVASQEKDEQRLYTLIRNRALASQMTDAVIDKTTAVIRISTTNTTMIARGALVIFPGFLAAFQASDTNKQLPEIKVGQTITLQTMHGRQAFTKPPARYGEATLVKKLEALGIGRPSTYRPIISIVQQRGYVEKTSREGTKRTYATIVLSHNTLQETQQEETVNSIKNKLLPTSIGMVVNDFLIKHFSDIMNYTFTAQTEEKLDQIAQNKLPWREMIQAFYTLFSEKIKAVEASKNEQHEQLKVRSLGQDPATGKPVYARLSRRYGPMVQLGDFDQKEKPRFASLKKEQLLEQVTLQEALELFKLPRHVGTHQQEPITAHIGRFGPYIKHKSTAVSLGKDHDPLTISAPVAIALIEQKAQQQQPIKTFEKERLEIRKGPYGYYIKTPNKNVSIPKTQDPTQLTLADCQNLIATAAQRKKRQPASKKK